MAAGSPSEWYSVKDVARLLDVSETTVHNAREDGRLTNWQRVGTGGRAPYRFAKAEIDGLDGVLRARGHVVVVRPSMCRI